jgi:hypothetical protein
LLEIFHRFSYKNNYNQKEIAMDNNNEIFFEEVTTDKVSLLDVSENDDTAYRLSGASCKGTACGAFCKGTACGIMC